MGNCRVCNIEFKGRQGQRYCSELCRTEQQIELRERKSFLQKQRYQEHKELIKERYRQRLHLKYPRKQVICRVCDQLFETGYGHQVCCSPACHVIWQRENCKRYYRQVTKPGAQPNRLIRCVACNQEFMTWQSTQITCSAACLKIRQQETYQLRRQTDWKRIREVEDRNQIRKYAAVKLYRELGFAASWEDRHNIYKALKAELPTLEI